MTSNSTAMGAQMDTSTLAPLTANAWLRYELIRTCSRPESATCWKSAAVRVRWVPGWPSASTTWGSSRTRCPSRSQQADPCGRRTGEVRNIPVQDLGDERFDLVCAFEVLEHIEDDAAAVKEWSSRLRAPGWLLLSVPAHQDRYGPFDEMVGHFRRYDPAAMTALLAGCGFTGIQYASMASRSATCWKPDAT